MVGKWIGVCAVSGVLLAGGCEETSDAATTVVDAGDPPAADGGADGAAAVSGIQQGTLIQLDVGDVQGDTDGATRRFRGIPFAEPPVGELRFAAPMPAQPWEGTLEALEYASGCPQLSSLSGEASEDEDCLYLNVWTPEPAPAEPLPVMFWLHGGGNRTGSASAPVPLGLGGPFYDGRLLAEEQNVVVVSTNYRLGVLGFFAQAALTAEGTAGNQGLRDQQVAMRWVADHIEAFGGDPDNVTIFGESAGAFNVCYHQLAPSSQGLFQRAISQSGGCTDTARTLADAEADVGAFVAAAGCADAADVLQCLRAVDVPTMLALADEGLAPFTPIVDGDLLPDAPATLFASASDSLVPYMLGSNADEGTLFLIGAPPIDSEEAYMMALEERYGDNAAAVAAQYPAADFDSPGDAFARATGDERLVCETRQTAIAAADAGAQVYLYNFARPIALPGLMQLGATHGAEIAYVFGTVEPPSDGDAALAAAMRGYWARFAATGDPNGGDAPTWPLYAPAMDQRLNLDTEISLVDDFRSEECTFWAGIYGR